MAKEEFPMIENEAPSCPGKIQIPTPEEKEALDAMMAIKEKVREKKARLSALKDDPDGNGEKMAHIEQELSLLKADWDLWEIRRSDAARKRMILLGHEKP